MQVIAILVLLLLGWHSTAFLRIQSISNVHQFSRYQTLVSTQLFSLAGEELPAEDQLDEPLTSAPRSPTSSKTRKRVSILLCPAQFCVPADYQDLLKRLRERSTRNETSPIVVGACQVAPLPRSEWIKVAKQLPTKSFFDATLPCHRTLDWYFTAMDRALSDIFAEEGHDVNICIIGHSIGGWVARAYLGGLSGSSTSVHRLTQKQCSSLITLGTPHSSPDTALVDQTRGLLKEVENTPACSSQALADRGIDVTCVGSSSISASVFTTDIEQIVAATSYLPLLGRSGKVVLGDGIIPTDLAFMDAPTRCVEIEKCKLTGVNVRHSHVFPTPWNIWNGGSPSLSLPNHFAWYGSEGVIEQWADFVS